MSPPGTNEFEQAARCWEQAHKVQHSARIYSTTGEELRLANHQAAAWEKGAQAWERAGELALEKAEAP